MSNVTRRWTIRALCLSACCVAAMNAHAAPPTYGVQVALPPTGDGVFWYSAVAFNNDGTMLVHTTQQGNVYHYYEVFDKRGAWVKTVGGDNHDGRAFFVDINNWGDVVGARTHDFGIWCGVVVKGQGFGATIYGFPDDEFGGYYSDAWAYGLSDNGHVVGQATGSRDGRQRAFVDGTELGTFGGATSIAYAVNSHGDAVGVADLADKSRHAFLYRGGEMKDLGTFGGPSSSPSDINEAGQVVGYADVADGSSRAFIYQQGQMTAIPTPEGRASTASAINRRGWVLGQYKVNGSWTPYLYDGTAVYPVADLLSPTERRVWTITSVVGLNDKGWLLANGIRSGEAHASVLFLKPLKSGA